MCGLFQSVCLLNVPLDLCLEFEEWCNLLSFIRPVSALELLMAQAEQRVKHVYLIKSIIYPAECTTRLKFILKFFTLKCSYMFRLTNHHQGAYCRAFLKLCLLTL